ncbi:ABC transporter ATP-binding protein [Sulfurospirillum barnesii]|uniref:Cell division ATP-binding protein FtsE n=1 Tax=Sulfurospirillum barnesii (strain ATCC 700032 / DSM 10660 / SES-3) TaxID=760154 RepID=I3Y0B5_SULBS|nr:ABC transporter ATP-binding protein [Sulfurospirillum barnesii]AFL69639.1 ABC-type antimicrobial peptide transport system, ATPase component [Sulfurospirillum barnesii SES-3]
MIVLENVYKQYETSAQRVDALQNISLHVKEGECVILKGASGSGKSTILSLIAGLCKPSSGNVMVDGASISKLIDPFSAHVRREKIGFIFQRFHLISNLSVKENILLPLIPSNPDAKVLDAKVNAVMQRCEIAHKANTLTRYLSGGEQQRVSIARALVNSPKIILADEPTANLDETLSLHFIDMLRSLKNEGVSMLIATHDPLFFQLEFADRIIEVKHGVIVG